MVSTVIHCILHKYCISKICVFFQSLLYNIRHISLLHNTSISQVCISAMLLLLTVGNQEVWHWGVLQWNNADTKFSEVAMGMDTYMHVLHPFLPHIYSNDPTTVITIKICHHVYVISLSTDLHLVQSFCHFQYQNQEWIYCEADKAEVQSPSLARASSKALAGAINEYSFLYLILYA